MRSAPPLRLRHRRPCLPASALQGDQTRKEALILELEAARYQAVLAERRYEASDPENRLVTAELEARWNAALVRASEAQHAVDALKVGGRQELPDREMLMKLATDFPAVWNAPTTQMRAKQRIAQILLTEIVVDLDASRHEVVALLHGDQKKPGAGARAQAAAIMPGFQRAIVPRHSSLSTRVRTCKR